MIEFSLLKDKRIAIVGLGYIGKHLYSYINQFAKTYNINIVTYNRSNLSQIEGEDFDYLFNCAGNTGNFRQQILGTIESNIGLNIYLLKKVNIKQCYVTLSSSRIYGFSKSPDILFKEDDLIYDKESHLSLSNVYNGAKKLMEGMLMNYSKNRPNLRIIICRLSNVFGSFQLNDLDDSTYLKLLIRHSIEDKHIILNQNPHSTKGYIYIGDVVNGLTKSATLSKETGIFNICSGQSYSILDWLTFLNISYSASSDILPLIHSKNSISKARNLIQFKPIFFLNNLNINQIVNYESNRHI